MYTLVRTETDSEGSIINRTERSVNLDWEAYKMMVSEIPWVGTCPYSKYVGDIMETMLTADIVELDWEEYKRVEYDLGGYHIVYELKQ